MQLPWHDVTMSNGNLACQTATSIHTNEAINGAI